MKSVYFHLLVALAIRMACSLISGVIFWYISCQLLKFIA